MTTCIKTQLSRLGCVGLLVTAAMTGDQRTQAQGTVNLPCVADAFTFSVYPNLNYGTAYNVLELYQYPPKDAMWSFLRFNLSDDPKNLPPGSIITAAELQLYRSTSGGQGPFTVALYSLNQPWSESVITWSNQPPMDLPVATATIPNGTNDWVAWNVTKLVQQWWSGTRTNNGLALVPTGTNFMQMFFPSREDVTNPPRLVISYSPPKLPPTITTQPQSLTVTQGDPVFFSVQATGTPVLSYQWWGEGIAIGGATNSTYNIVSAQTNHAGAYSVVISNLAGQIVSSNAILTVLGKPHTNLRILATHLATDGSITFDYPSDAASYFILLRGTNLFDIQQPVGIKLGTNSVDSLADVSQGSPPKVGFYRLRQVPLTQALDSDGDGIDDVYELRHSFLNPLVKADGALDFDHDGGSNAEEYRLHTDPTQPDTLIESVSLAKTNFCAGEEVELLVNTRHPLGASNLTHVVVNGVLGRHQFLHFTGLAGPRLICVVASTDQGFVESRTIPISIQTNGPCQSVLFHDLGAALNPYHSYTMDFVVLNPQALGSAAQGFVWDFGDGHSQTTTLPTVSHDYEAATDDSKPYFDFTVTVKSLDGILQTRLSFAMLNNYYEDKQRGIIQPRVLSSGVMEPGGTTLIGRYSLRNLEVNPIRFTQALLEYRFADDQQPSQYQTVAPGDILFKGGFEEKVLSQQSSTNPAIRYAQQALALQTPEFPNVAIIPGTNTHRASWKPLASDLPAGTTVVACHLKGDLLGRTNAVVYASLYFEVAPPPRLVQPVTKFDLRAFLNEIANRGWVPNTNDISAEDLHRLQLEGKIRQQSTGWEIP